MAHIDYYFVTLSPWAYLAGMRLEEIAARHGASITYKPANMEQVFAATGGKPLKERSQARQDYRLQEMRRAKIKTGLDMVTWPAFFPTNAAPSSYAIIAAQAANEAGGTGDMGKLVHGILRAVWAEEKNVAEDAVIRDCLTAAGFDPALADSGLLTGAVAFEKNTEEAIQVGAFGAPFYIVDGTEKFWGQDRLDDLDAYLGGAL